MKLRLFILLVVFTLGACSENNESPLVIFLTPQETVIEANTNEHVLIDVVAHANEGKIMHLNITQKDEYSGITHIMDSSLDNHSLYYTLDYIIPEFPDSTEILLTFSIMDNLGNKIQSARRLLLNKGSSLIRESSGHVIYSSLSNKPNAFNLKKLTPGYSSDLFDKDVYFMDNSIDSIHGNVLSRVWISRNGLNFVQYNGFNYAMANSLTISNAYSSGVKLSKAVDIKDSDILLIGRENTAIGAIQIINITDTDSTLNDKYVFNLKIVESFFDD